MTSSLPNGNKSYQFTIFLCILSKTGSLFLIKVFAFTVSDLVWKGLYMHNLISSSQQSSEGGNITDKETEA